MSDNTRKATNSTNTTLHRLEKPEKLSTILKNDPVSDCLPCKVIGSSVFLGLSAFNYATGIAQLNRREAEILKSGSMFGMRSRRWGIVGISMGLAYMGVYRAVA